LRNSSLLVLAPDSISFASLNHVENLLTAMSARNRVIESLKFAALVRFWWHTQRGWSCRRDSHFNTGRAGTFLALSLFTISHAQLHSGLLSLMREGGQGLERASGHLLERASGHLGAWV